MTNQDMDYLARKIVGLERKHSALARAWQLPSSSIKLVDGTDVQLSDTAEDAQDNRNNLIEFDRRTTQQGSIADAEAIHSVAVPDWITGANDAADVAWESTQYAIDLAAQLEADLGPLPGQIQEALDEAAEAKQTALDAAAGAANAESAANAAATAASVADGNAVAAQTAAGNAQSAADDAAEDALAAANAAAAADTKATNAATAASNAASAASTADGKAVAAQNAANAAQTTANAKGKVIIQSAAPAAADQLVQNLWIDTTGGANTPKRWNGTAWVAVTDKAATDAAAAAVTAQNRANEAFDEAVAAATAAGNAQTSADNKNRVWYQTTAPAGTGHSVGDTWFDTDDGNSIYRWSGSAWVRAQLGTNSLTDSAVNAAKLASNAVTSAKIAADAITDAKLAPAVRTSIATAQSTATNAQNIANAAQDAAAAAQAEAAVALARANVESVVVGGSAPSVVNYAPSLYGPTVPVEVRRNVATNPRMLSALSLPLNNYPAANTLTKSAPLPVPHPQGIVTGAKSVSNGSSAELLSVYGVDNLTAAGSPERMLGVWVLVTEPGYRVDHFNGWAAQELTANTWTYLTQVTPLSADTWGGIQVSRITGMASTTAECYMTGCVAAPGTVPPAQFFDDQYSPDPDMTPELVPSGNGASRLIGQHPTAFTDVNCVSIIHEVGDGTRELRQIPTTASHVTYTRYDIPATGTLRADGTSMATLRLPAPQTGTLNYYARSVWADEPSQITPQSPNVAGTYQHRLHYINLTSVYRTYLYAGGTAGSSDVYWSKIGLFEGDYTGPNIDMSRVLWIDTTGNANTPKRWDGTTWVTVTDKAATDAAAAAAAANTLAGNAQTIANAAQTAAGAAQTAANNAQTAANAAQTTANGKNKIVRSTADASAPENYVAGDQWWKYSGTQITAMWLHTGSAWTAQTLTDSVITNLNAGTITAGTIAAARIEAATITGTHIAGATVTASNMVAGTITAASGIIADAAIGSAKIVDGAITTAKIGDAQITNAKIANLDAGKITTGTLDANRIGANSITAAKMVVGTITAASGIIADAAITNAKIANLDAAKINTGTLNAARIGAGSIVAEKLATGAVTTDKILANAITTAKLAATAIDGMTITGALIRTAATGQRVQLDVNGLRTFNSGNTETARLASDGTGLRLTGPLMSVSGDGTAAVKLDIGLVELTSNLGTGWTDRTALTAAGLTTNNDSQLTISNTSNEAGTGVGIVSGSVPSNQAYLTVNTGTGSTNSSITFNSDTLLHNNRPVYSKEGTGTIALASGSSATAATTLWKDSDGVVWFNITITRTSWTTGGVTTLGTMPTGFRPGGDTVTFPATTFGAAAPYNSFVQISTDGTIFANNSPTNGQSWNVAFIGFFRT